MGSIPDLNQYKLFILGDDPDTSMVSLLNDTMATPLQFVAPVIEQMTGEVQTLPTTLSIGKFSV